MKSFLFLVLIAILSNTSAELPLPLSTGPTPIPGTDLLTETPYKISPRNFPTGVLTFTATTDSVDKYHYVQVDNNLDNAANYEPGGKWHNDSLWEFHEAVPCQEWQQLYTLVNKGLQNHALTWSDREFPEEPGQTNYIVMANSESTRKARYNFMLTPISVKYDNLDYYQLKLFGVPRGVVTYSRKTSFKARNPYIMLDETRNSKHMNNYNWGPEGQDNWYNTTMFAFDKLV